MDRQELYNHWLIEEQQPFFGWDFTHLSGRWHEEGLPWKYKKFILQYLQPNHQLLDMGTGGGEFLLTLGHPYENTSVTEAWEPNVEQCKNRLEPLGITVKQLFKEEHLPFPDPSFDMIINRHEAYDVKEIKRILKPGGMFITQQVGGENNECLSHSLIESYRPMYANLCLENERKKLMEHDFVLLFNQEYFPYLRFFDVGAIVYYAKIIEWEFPGFSVKKCRDQLIKLQQTLEKEGYIETFEHRFIIVAKKPHAVS
ncbi:class I SAM-dependent methyltransferase [Bacillus sp. FJAT-50079]|uniref:class I SAM-dependent methyltransferase n=1 Tax=Bacillus sp. FJAT-50079 TaxID=2833577 RepID=UPI001BC9D8D7|nr:class I SAM-dependent methyltransferase [Bacillus sp. FJAT-50079]MBS4208856.1 class I SAM-dependent methyltransferase [Bacillus sp. FJAT-50079]